MVEDKAEFGMAGLGGHIVFGVYIKGGHVMNCPGNTIARMHKPQILQYLMMHSVKKVTVVAGTNNLFDRDNRVGGVQAMTERMRALVRDLQDFGMNMCIIKVLGRVGHKKAINDLWDTYWKMAISEKVLFHCPRRFTFSSVVPDGLHRKTSELWRFANNIFDALQMLG